MGRKMYDGWLGVLGLKSGRRMHPSIPLQCSTVQRPAGEDKRRTQPVSALSRTGPTKVAKTYKNLTP